MKKKSHYYVNDRPAETEVNYIPVRYIIAVLITLLEIVAVLAIVIACCYFIPYFYILAWCTEIACVIKIISSDDNPDYKVPLAFVCAYSANSRIYALFYVLFKDTAEKVYRAAESAEG